MKRRELTLGLLSIGIAAATHAGAQTAASLLPRVVIITNGDEAFFQPFRDRFLHGMRELGHAEGRTFRLEVQYAHGEPARSVTLIREAIAGRPDVLVVGGLTNARRAREATKTVPVVVATSSDLVDAGIVASFARPGGNITGITDLVDELAVKRLELLKELRACATIMCTFMKMATYPGGRARLLAHGQAGVRLGSRQAVAEGAGYSQ